MKKNIFTTIFQTNSIAIVGASRSPQKIGYQLTKNLISDGYPGDLFPINPHANTILNLKTYPTLSKLPRIPELVIVVTPAPLVPAIITEAGNLGVKAAIIISAGFAEGGNSGSLLQQQLTQAQTKSSIRLLGPNCLGVLNPSYHLNASFGPHLPQKGGILLISQSGALVTGILDWINARKLGLSAAITLGNRLDISEIDALNYAAQDTKTKLILIYLESFQNAPAFFSLASRIAPKKPIILLKGGSTLEGQSASLSHTAALATNQVLVDAFAKQTGVLIVEDMETWLSTATFLVNAPKMPGNAVAIITNAGGPGVLTADALVQSGLKLAQFNRSTLTALKQQLPLSAPQNPLDILGDAPPERYATALKILESDRNIHATIILMTPQTSTQPQKAAQVISQQLVSNKLPVVAITIGGTKIRTAYNQFKHYHLPVFDFPNEAVKVLSAKARFHQFFKTIEPYPSKIRFTPVIFPIKTNPQLTLKASLDLLDRAGFNLPKYTIISTLSEVPQALKYVSVPAVIKTAAPRLPHKAKVGGVILDCMTVMDARIAFQKMHRLYPKVLFQQTIHGQLELILGAKFDPQLGPFVMIGLGGTFTNALADRAYAFIPVQPRLFQKSIMTTKAYRAILDANLPLKEVTASLVKISTLLLSNPHLSELEINPAILTSKKLYAADIKITLKD